MTNPESPAVHGLNSWGIGPFGEGKGAKIDRGPRRRERDTELGRRETQRWGDRNLETDWPRLRKESGEI